jgi:hypothetical protein
VTFSGRYHMIAKTSVCWSNQCRLVPQPHDDRFFLAIKSLMNAGQRAVVSGMSILGIAALETLLSAETQG